MLEIATNSGTTEKRPQSPTRSMNRVSHLRTPGQLSSCSDAGIPVSSVSQARALAENGGVPTVEEPSSNGTSNQNSQSPSGLLDPPSPGSLRRLSTGNTTKVLADLQAGVVHARQALENTRSQLRLAQRSVAQVSAPLDFDRRTLGKAGEADIPGTVDEAKRGPQRWERAFALTKRKSQFGRCAKRAVIARGYRPSSQGRSRSLVTQGAIEDRFCDSEEGDEGDGTDGHRINFDFRPNATGIRDTQRLSQGSPRRLAVRCTGSANGVAPTRGDLEERGAWFLTLSRQSHAFQIDEVNLKYKSLVKLTQAAQYVSLATGSCKLKGTQVGARKNGGPQSRTKRARCQV